MKPIYFIYIILALLTIAMFSFKDGGAVSKIKTHKEAVDKASDMLINY